MNDDDFNSLSHLEKSILTVLSLFPHELRVTDVCLVVTSLDDFNFNYSEKVFRSAIRKMLTINSEYFSNVHYFMNSGQVAINRHYRWDILNSANSRGELSLWAKHLHSLLVKQSVINSQTVSYIQLEALAGVAVSSLVNNYQDVVNSGILSGYDNVVGYGGYRGGIRIQEPCCDFFTSRNGMLVFDTIGVEARRVMLGFGLDQNSTSDTLRSEMYGYCFSRIKELFPIGESVESDAGKKNLFFQLFYIAVLSGERDLVNDFEEYAKTNNSNEFSILFLLKGDYRKAFLLSEVGTEEGEVVLDNNYLINKLSGLALGVFNLDDVFSEFSLLLRTREVHSATYLQRLFRRLMDFWAADDDLLVENLAVLERQDNGRFCPEIYVQEKAMISDALFDTNVYKKNWHFSRGYIPLVNIVKRKSNWEYRIKQLNSYIPTSVEIQKKRIRWNIVISKNSVDLIEAKEQTQNAKGSWSKGRAIGNYVQHIRENSYIENVDVRILSVLSMKANTNYSSSPEFYYEKAVLEMVGHDNVYLSMSGQETPVDVVLGNVSLIIKNNNEHIDVLFEPNFYVLGKNKTMIVHRETPTRLQVIELTPDINKISKIVGKGISVPLSEKNQLIDSIKLLAPHLQINSDLPELMGSLPSVDADPKLYVHLLPLKAEGLKIQFLVRPIVDGTWFRPGGGSPVLIGKINNAPVQTIRDLDGELVLFTRVHEKCLEVLSSAIKEDDGYFIDEPADCLELLSTLKELVDLEGGVLELVWPEGERFRLKGRRTIGQMKLGMRQEGDWFVLNGEIELDDGKVMQLRQLMSGLKESGSRFIKLNDNDFIALSQAMTDRLNELSALVEHNGKDGLKIGVLASGLVKQLADEVGEFESDLAWKTHIEKLSSLELHTPLAPEGLNAQLREYQLEGYQWLSRLAQWGVGANLCDDMGLGKTVQTLALLLERAPSGPALVVAPTSVAINWPVEAAKFAPALKVRSYHGERNLDDLGPYELVIVSYGLLQSDSDDFAAVHWNTVILDEAQSIKNANTLRSKAVMKLTSNFKMIATGTPMENHLGEMWNLFHFTNPSLLGSKDRFAKRFANAIEQGDQTAKTALKKLIQPFILRRKKSDVLTELPPRTEINHVVKLSNEERHHYEALRQEAIERLSVIDEEQEGAQHIQILAELTKLRRFCCHPQLVTGNTEIAGSKLAAFEEIVDELIANEHKALVFSQFVDHLTIIRTLLDKRGIGYQYLDGACSPKKRKDAVDSFQGGESPLFLISLKAGGSGLNLTAADYVIHLDPWWNPAVEDQASDRAHRMGQLRPVTIYRLVTENTIEEKILELHSSKRDLANSLLENGDASGKLGASELLAILKSTV